VSTQAISPSGLESLRWADDSSRGAGSLQQLPKDAELLAFEPGSERYCEREVDDYLVS
jgi:hypothetical protein